VKKFNNFINFNHFDFSSKNAFFRISSRSLIVLTLISGMCLLFFLKSQAQDHKIVGRSVDEEENLTRYLQLNLFISKAALAELFWKLFICFAV